MITLKPQTVVGTFVATFVATFVITIAGVISAHAATPAAPVATKTAWQETRHGEVVTDDHRWLHKKQSPEVTAYLNAENAYTEAMTADIAPLSEKLFAEIKGRMQEVDLPVPVRRGNYYYHSPFEAGKQYAIKARRPAVGERQAYDESAPKEILLNQNVLAEGQKYFRSQRVPSVPAMA